MRQRLLLIDGNPLVYKAYWSTQGGTQLTTQDGRVVSAAYTFSRMILSLLRRPLWSEANGHGRDARRSTLAAVCFDNPFPNILSEHFEDMCMHFEDVCLANSAGSVQRAWFPLFPKCFTVECNI